MRWSWCCADGTDVETPVCDRSPDFLGRPEAYDMAAGAVEGWLEAATRHPRVPPACTPRSMLIMD